MLDLAGAAELAIALAPDDVGADGRLKPEACSLWAIMALDAAARAEGGQARMASFSLELGPALSVSGLTITVKAETTKRSRAIAFLKAEARDPEGRLLFSASAVFGLSGG